MLPRRQPPRRGHRSLRGNFGKNGTHTADKKLNISLLFGKVDPSKINLEHTKLLINGYIHTLYTSNSDRKFIDPIAQICQKYYGIYSAKLVEYYDHQNLFTNLATLATSTNDKDNKDNKDYKQNQTNLDNNKSTPKKISQMAPFVEFILTMKGEAFDLYPIFLNFVSLAGKYHALLLENKSRIFAFDCYLLMNFESLTMDKLSFSFDRIGKVQIITRKFEEENINGKGTLKYTKQLKSFHLALNKISKPPGRMLSKQEWNRNHAAYSRIPEYQPVWYTFNTNRNEQVEWDDFRSAVWEAFVNNRLYYYNYDDDDKKDSNNNISINTCTPIAIENQPIWDLVFFIFLIYSGKRDNRQAKLILKPDDLNNQKLSEKDKGKNKDKEKSKVDEEIIEFNPKYRNMKIPNDINAKIISFEKGKAIECQCYVEVVSKEKLLRGFSFGGDTMIKNHTLLELLFRLEDETMY